METKQIRRVGGTDPIQCDVRLVTATNLDLKGAVEEGKFRRDLYYRLAQLEIRLPSLRERVEDIEMLAMRFLQQANEDFGRKVKRISPSSTVRSLERFYSPIQGVLDPKSSLHADQSSVFVRHFGWPRRLGNSKPKRSKSVRCHLSGRVMQWS